MQVFLMYAAETGAGGRKKGEPIGKDINYKSASFS